MKKTLILALAATTFTLAGCADDAAEEVDNTTVIEAPAEPVEPMMADSTMMEGGTMEGGAMEGAAPMAGDSAATGSMESTMPMEGTTADSAAAGM